MTASPTPKLATDAQIPTFKALADVVHKHGAKVALQLFHPEYDVPGVGRMVMGSMVAAKAAQEAKAAGDEETFAAKMAESNEIRNQAYAKLHHDMQHFVNEASVEQLTQIKEAIAASAARAQQAGHRRHRGSRRPFGGFAVLGHPQPAHRRVRWLVREPRPLRAGGRRCH